MVTTVFFVTAVHVLLLWAQLAQTLGSQDYCSQSNDSLFKCASNQLIRAYFTDIGEQEISEHKT